jgi:hypothetical protein
MTRRAASSPGQLYEQTVAKRSVPLPGVPARTGAAISNQARFRPNPPSPEWLGR